MTVITTTKDVEGLTFTLVATEQVGPTLTPYDARPLCAYARFCDVAGQVWNLVEQDGAEAAEMTA